jgi:hypothetical protein
LQPTEILFDSRQILWLCSHGMKTKVITVICTLAIGWCSVTSSYAATDNNSPEAVAADALVARPACLAATVVGSAIFIVALLPAALSKSVKKTANALVVKPARGAPLSAW